MLIIQVNVRFDNVDITRTVTGINVTEDCDARGA